MKFKKDIFALFTISLLLLSSISSLQYFNLSYEWHDSGTILYTLASPADIGNFRSYDYDISFLADHFSPLFILLSPIFQFYPFLELWLLIQIIVISAGICVIYAIFLYFSEDRISSFGVSIAFLVNPYVIHTHLYPHYEVFYLLFIPLFFYFVIKEKFGLSILFLICILITKEDGWIYSIGASIILLRRSRLKFILICISASLLYFLIVIKFGTIYIFPNQVNSFSNRWGKTQSEYLNDLVYNPYKYIKLLWSGQGKYLLLSVLGLPWLSGWRSLPGWGVSILWMSSVTLDRAYLSFYYGLPSIILLYISLPNSLSNLKKIISILLESKFFPRLLTSLRKLENYRIDTSKIIWTFSYGFPTLSLILVSMTITFWPGNYLTRGPNVPRLIEELDSWDSNKVKVLTLREIRDQCPKSSFVSFYYAPYLYCGKDLRLPFKDWDAVKSGYFLPELVILADKKTEPLLQTTSPADMKNFFDSNSAYIRIKDPQVNLHVWRKKGNFNKTL